MAIGTQQKWEKLLFYLLTDIKQGCVGALQSMRLQPEAEYLLELTHCGSATPQKLSDVQMAPKPVFQRGINTTSVRAYQPATLAIENVAACARICWAGA